VSDLREGGAQANLPGLDVAVQIRDQLVLVVAHARPEELGPAPRSPGTTGMNTILIISALENGRGCKSLGLQKSPLQLFSVCLCHGELTSRVKS